MYMCTRRVYIRVLCDVYRRRRRRGQQPSSVSHTPHIKHTAAAALPVTHTRGAGFSYWKTAPDAEFLKTAKIDSGTNIIL